MSRALALDRPTDTGLLIATLPLWRNGRRGGLKIRGRKAWEFESPRGHHPAMPGKRPTHGEQTLDPVRDAGPTAPSAEAAPDPGGALEGFLGARRIYGWAGTATPPGGTSMLVVRLRGQEVARLSTGGHGMPELFAGIGESLGFVLDLPDAYVLGDLATRRLTVHPLHAEAVLGPLAIRPRLLAQEQVAAGHAMLLRAEDTLGTQGLAAMLGVLGRPQGFGAAQLAAAANAALAASVAGSRPRDVALSPLHFPVGLRSAGGGVVLGHDGHLFLLAGSNGEVARLGAEPEQRARLVAAWLALIEARRARCEALGIRFVQLIVPEKAALVPELLPDPGQGGASPLLKTLEVAVAERPALADCTLSGLAVLRAAARAQRAPISTMVRRLDSHPSAAGMLALARAVLARVGETPPDLGDRFRRPWLADGDLCRNFLPEPCFEEVPQMPPRALTHFGAEPALVEAFQPPDGGHVGRREHWRTERAPSLRRLLAFGNSVSGTAVAGQNLLSGWLARWFAEYHFHWQPDVDWAVVEAVRPDILLCQTVERFMGRVPES